MRRHRPSESQRQAPAADRWRVFAVCIFLIAITWLVFGQTLHHEFVGYDDSSNVSGRPEIVSGLTLRGVGAAFTHRYVSNWVPLTAISHLLDCQFFGLNAGGHHFTN